MAERNSFADNRSFQKCNLLILKWLRKNAIKIGWIILAEKFEFKYTLQRFFNFFWNDCMFLFSTSIENKSHCDIESEFVHFMHRTVYRYSIYTLVFWMLVNSLEFKMKLEFWQHLFVYSVVTNNVWIVTKYFQNVKFFYQN